MADMTRAVEGSQGRFDPRRFYDRIAGLYSFGARWWQGYAMRALPWLPQEGRLLEIGPGPGLLLARLATRGRAFGIDLSWDMIRRARHRLARAGLSVPLVQGDGARLPFADASFRGIAITFTFSAIPQGLEAMREMARVLQPGGRLVLVDAGIPEDENRMAVFLAHLWERFGDTMRDEAALMSRLGFDLLHREEFGPWRCMRIVVGEKKS